MGWWTYAIHHNYDRRDAYHCYYFDESTRLILFGWCFNYPNTCSIMSVSMSNAQQNVTTKSVSFWISNLFSWSVIEWDEWREEQNGIKHIVSYHSTGELKNGLFQHSESTFLHTPHIVYIISVDLSLVRLQFTRMSLGTIKNLKVILPTIFNHHVFFWMNMTKFKWGECI